MAQTIRIALDLMGGDRGPEIAVPGAAIALERRPEIRYVLYGRETDVGPLLARYPSVRDFSVFQHTDVAVRMEDKPSQALRAGRWKSSMWLALEAVKNGQLRRNDAITYELPDARSIAAAHGSLLELGRDIILHVRPDGPARFIVEHGAPDGGIAWFDTP